MNRQEYGNRRLVSYDAAADTLEIEIRRTIRSVTEAIKDQDRRVDWSTFHLEVNNSGSSRSPFVRHSPIPNTLEISMTVMGDPL